MVGRLGRGCRSAGAEEAANDDSWLVYSRGVIRSASRGSSEKSPVEVVVCSESRCLQLGFQNDTVSQIDQGASRRREKRMLPELAFPQS